MKLISVQVGDWRIVTNGLGTDRTGVAEGRPVPVRVFISYAHDDPGHEDRVRDFWLFLREQGIDARADLPAVERRQDWADWMTRQVRDADRVLVIASPEYRRRAEGDAQPGEGRGVQWEARLIRDRFYADQQAGLQLIVPVVLPGCSADDIPLWMGPAATTYYRVTEYTVVGAEKLLRLLTGQPWETEPPLGTIPILPLRGAGITSHRPLTETGNEAGLPDFAATGEQSDSASAAVENSPPTVGTTTLIADATGPARRARVRLRAIAAGVVGIIGVLASIATVVPQLDPFLSSPSPAKSSPTASNCSAPRRLPPGDVVLPGGLTATEFVLPRGSQPIELATDQGGNFWFTEWGRHKIGWMSPDHTFVECQIPTPGAHPFAITAGPGGNMWFTEGNPDRPSASGNSIGMITPQGQITEYTIPTPGSAAVGITKGPDGNLWFTEYQAGKIGRITVTGTISEVSLPQGGQPDQIITGPDGNLWFTEFGGNKIGRLTSGGVLSEFPTFRAGNPVGIVSRDGALWFAEVSDGLIGRMNTSGKMLGWIPVPNREKPGPANLAVDRHDAVWFTEAQAGQVGYIAGTTPLSVSHEYAVTGNGSLLIDIIIGPDANPWFTVQDADVIGRIARS